MNSCATIKNEGEYTIFIFDIIRKIQKSIQKY